MSIKSQLLSSGAFGGMTANESRLGRFIRDGEGHPAPAPAPASEPIVAPEPEGTNFNLSDFESGQVVDPATPAPEQADLVDPLPLEEPQGSSAQEQIDAAVAAAQAEHDRQLADATRVADDLRKQLEALKSPKVDDKDSPRSPADKEPNPADYEFGAADERYLSDRVDWLTNERFARHDQEQTVRAQVEAIDSRWNEVVQAEPIQQKYPDFADKVTKGAEAGTWDCTAIEAVLIKKSPVGADIAYHLASNPEESKRIAALDPQGQLLEIGRLEGRFQYAAEAESKAPTPIVRPSDAPAPPAEKARGSSGQFVSGEKGLYRKMLAEFD